MNLPVAILLRFSNAAHDYRALSKQANVYMPIQSVMDDHSSQYVFNEQLSIFHPAATAEAFTKLLSYLAAGFICSSSSNSLD
jgi:hypothetical protein